MGYPRADIGTASAHEQPVWAPHVYSIAGSANGHGSPWVFHGTLSWVVLWDVYCEPILHYICPHGGRLTGMPKKTVHRGRPTMLTMGSVHRMLTTGSRWADHHGEALTLTLDNPRPNRSGRP